MGKHFCSPLISVIVPVYKVERYIENCLNSLLAQTYTNWEAILVDDGSPDQSGEICEHYVQKDSRFKVIHKPNGGLSSARNAGLKIADGDYVFFLDSDDFLRKDTLEHLTNLAGSYNADIVQCDFIRGQESVFPEIKTAEIIQVYNNKSIFTSFATKIITCGKLYKRSILDGISFPEGLVNEDDFTTWKFYYNARQIVITSLKLYYYTINHTSIMAQQRRKPNLKYFDAYRERIQFFLQHNEPELLAASRVQWMKSLVMLYGHPALTQKEKGSVAEAYKENYSGLYATNFAVPKSLNLIFKSFKVAPWLVSRAVSLIYHRLR